VALLRVPEPSVSGPSLSSEKPDVAETAAAEKAPAEKAAAEKAAAEKAAAENAAVEKAAAEKAAQPDLALSVQPGSGQSFRDRLTNGQPCPMCPEMVVVPSGKFTMGSPNSEPERGTVEDQVSVSIAEPFAVGKYAVTRGEFAAFVEETGHKTDGGCFTGGKQEAGKSWRAPGFAQDDQHPILCVSWDDAKAYLAWLSSKTGKTYRLLSESEREYVTRAGTTTPFWWGTSITPSQANYNGNYPYGREGSKGEFRQRTVPVDSFKANPWGIYNVHGNVWEWTEDCWNERNSGNPGNGSAKATGDCKRRVVRGGSWFNTSRRLRSADRAGEPTVSRSSILGFRIGRTLTP
jgi:formylglycine-generating enzyme required for sulfatase activity